MGIEITEDQLKEIVEDFLTDKIYPNQDAMECALEKQGIKVKREFKLKKGRYYRSREGMVWFIFHKNPLTNRCRALHIRKFDYNFESFGEKGNFLTLSQNYMDLIEEVEDQHWFDKED